MLRASHIPGSSAAGAREGYNLNAFKIYVARRCFITFEGPIHHKFIAHHCKEFLLCVFFILTSTAGVLKTVEDFERLC